MTTLFNTLLTITSALVTIAALIGGTLAPELTVEIAKEYAPYMVGGLLGAWIIHMAVEIVRT